MNEKDFFDSVDFHDILPKVSRGASDFDHATEVSQATVATLLDTLQEAVTIVDAVGVVRHWSAAAKRLYGIDAEDIVGKPIVDFPWKSLILDRVLKEGISVHQLYHEPRPHVHVLINALPIRVHGDIVGAIATEQDVTSMVRLGDELMNTTRQLATLEGTVQRKGNDFDAFEGILGHGSVMTKAIDLARRVATSNATVFLYGESGVGKELFAHAIHRASKQSKGPFIAVNCGAIPQALFESELFGYQSGTFTGADRKGKMGKMELAQKGTLFLDEIGELPLELQVKLLRVLEDRVLYRIGSERGIDLDVRIISATNRDLQMEVKSGRFRADLYYRLNVVSLDLPPLRDHMEDIPLLVQRFAHQFAIQYNKVIPSFDPDVILALMRFSWPGNVRQLKNIVERVVILADEDHIHVHHLPAEVQQFVLTKEDATVPYVMQDRHEVRETLEDHANFLGNQNHVKFPSTNVNFTTEAAAITTKIQKNKRGVTEAILQAALLRTYGNKAAAARELGVSRATLYHYMRVYGISDDSQVADTKKS